VNPVEPVRVGQAIAALPEYEWRGECRMPRCGDPAVDPHHIVLRSQGGRYWITIDGTPVANVAGICRRHHDLIHAGRVQVVWGDGQGAWVTGQGERLKALYSRDTHVRTASGKCPTCGRHWPTPQPWKITRRKKVALTVQVPDDHENGTEIVTNLLAAAAEKMKAQGMNIDDPEAPGLRYYTLVGVLHDYLTSGNGRAGE
jgi:hypothetical protein